LHSLNDGFYTVAAERGIAEIIAQFERTPDAFLREVEVHAALFRTLQEQHFLAQPYATEDGRYTGLVHRCYPSFLEETNETHRPHDVVLLNPRFVRGYPLDIVANRDGRGSARLGSLEEEDRPIPLLSTVRLCLVRDLARDTLDTLEDQFRVLARVRRENWTQRCYMGIFCRHWDLVQHLHEALPTLEQWAAAQENVSLVVVQSYYDDAGRVFGGRYLNLWTHMAPLPPLDSPQAAPMGHVDRQ
jgi:hypothetical protein